MRLMYNTNAKTYVLRVDDFLWNLKVFGEFTRGHQDDASLFLTGLVERLQQEELKCEMGQCLFLLVERLTVFTTSERSQEGDACSGKHDADASAVWLLLVLFKHMPCVRG